MHSPQGAGGAPSGPARGSAWNDVTEERVVINGHPLAVVRPRDSAALIDEERFARDEFLPYWAELWPSALALAAAVEGMGATLAGLRVVELGCGLGLPSIVAARHGASVLATDWAAEALPFVTVNADRNDVEVAVLECGWADPAPIIEKGPYDVVVASDVLYERINVPLLVQLLPQLVAPREGFALVADPGRPALPAFRDAIREAGWAETPVGPGGGVTVLRLVPPDGRRP